MEAIINKINSFSKGYRCCVYLPINTSLIEDLKNSASKIDYEGLKKYRDFELNEILLSKKEEPCLIMSPEKSLTFPELNPIITNLIQTQILKIKNLQQKIEFLKMANVSLTEEKKVKKEFHGPFLERLKSHEYITGAKKIFDAISELSKQIKWQEPRETSSLCGTCENRLDNLSPFTRRMVRGNDEKKIKSELERLQDKVSRMISKLNKNIESEVLFHK